MRITLLALLFAFGLSDTFACSVPPRHLYLSNQELVYSTPVIVLAKAVSASAHPSQGLFQFQFQTLQSLKGSSSSTFELIGYAADLTGSYKDFGEHQIPEFWAFDAGNSIMPGDCRAYGVFEIGQEYLLFLKEEPHVRAFENIRSKDDLWLEVIHLLIKSEGEFK